MKFQIRNALGRKIINIKISRDYTSLLFLLEGKKEGFIMYASSYEFSGSRENWFKEITNIPKILGGIILDIQELNSLQSIKISEDKNEQFYYYDIEKAWNSTGHEIFGYRIITHKGCGNIILRNSYNSGMGFDSGYAEFINEPSTDLTEDFDDSKDGHKLLEKEYV